MENKYEGVPIVTQVTEGIYIFKFTDVALRVSLHVDFATMGVLSSKKLDTLRSDINETLKYLIEIVANNKTISDSGIRELNVILSAGASQSNLL